jgi:glycerophosphoryl diester phosphodiesterase
MKVIAHRGSSQATPENTLPSIRKAIRDGADAIEIDVQLTKDQQIIVIHDEWLNRTTNGNGFICDSPYSYIRQLDAGSWFGPQFKGTKVPLLEEVLTLLQSTSLDIHVELKNNLIHYNQIENRVTELIQQKGMEEQVVISSFRRNSLELCKALAPNIRRGYLCWSTLSPLLRKEEWEDLQLYSIHPHISLVTSEVSKLQELGYKVFPYVIQRKKDLLLCLKTGVDGLFTNCPGRVQQLLERYYS